MCLRPILCQITPLQNINTAKLSGKIIAVLMNMQQSIIQSNLSLSTASQPFADVTSTLAYFALTSGLKLKN